MKLSSYLQGLRTTHYICVIKSQGQPLVVLSIPKKDASYEEAKELFREQLLPLKESYGGKFNLSYYK